MKNGDLVHIRELIALNEKLERKIDNCVTKEEFNQLVEKVDDLRNWKWKITGFAGGIGAVVGLGISTFKDMVK